ncbi:MAG: helix-turn-helix domain-containing protein, partial [Pseudonocardiaceae bacterium]
MRARKAAGFTQEKLAYRLRVDRSTIGRWESGETEPLPGLQPKLADLLGVTRARLSELLAAASLGSERACREDSAGGLPAAHISARHEGNDSSHLGLAVSSPTTPLPPSSNTVMSPWGVVSEINPSSVEPIDESFITSIHARIFELLALDARVGGNETSGQALRLFRAVHRRIGVSPCPKRLRRDLYAAVGELAEVAGWLFYDADQQDSMRRMNQEALYYLRWAGCRSLELLTLQNMSMQA